MEEDQRYERFDVDNDFEEGGQFIGGEFFGVRRKGRQQTKEEALYGYQTDSEEERDPRRTGRKKADYSKGVSFVSSGVVQPPEEPPEVKAEAGAAAEEDEGGWRPGLGGLGSASAPGGGRGGLGSGAAPSGLGFGGPQGAAVQGPQPEEDPDEHSVLPGEFGRRIRSGAEKRARAEQQAASKRAKRQASNLAGGQEAAASGSAFLAHSSGIASRLMEKMGYRPGEGLGAQGQGIAKPIEVKMRPKNLGMGFRGFAEQAAPPPEAAAPAEEERQAPAAAQQKLWKKRGAPGRVKREYRTAADVLEAAAEKPPAAAAAQPILDMRGPQARVVTNLEHLNAEGVAGGPDEALPMPELQHNLRLLVDLAEADIRRLDGKLRQQQDTAVGLGRDQARQQGEAQKAAAATARLEHVLAEVERAAGAPPHAELDALRPIYAALLAGYREEYILHNLPAAALAQVLPRVTSLLADWNPLLEPQRGLQTLRGWKPLLEDASQHDAVFQGLQEDAYDRLLAAAVIPRVSAALTDWQPRNAEPAVAWFELWHDVLPPGTRRFVLESIIFPKVQAAVNAWDPTSEPVALHVWLHPWLPYLGGPLEGLYPGVRYKLATALQRWHPQDASALEMLRPWQRVFEAKEWEGLLARSILPRLAWALSEALQIDPAAQVLEPWHYTMAWAPLLPAAQLVALLEQKFFPQWHRVLAHWLAHSPDYDEVTRWYLGWKALLPEEVRDHERIRAHWSAALNAMNAASGGDEGPYPPAAAAGYAYPEAGVSAAGLYARDTHVEPSPGTGAAAAAEVSLRQLLEQQALDHHLTFMPKQGRRHEGLQVYGFGGISIIMDSLKLTLKAHLEGQWQLTTIEDLVAHARRRRGKG